MSRYFSFNRYYGLRKYTVPDSRVREAGYGREGLRAIGLVLMNYISVYSCLP
jgi:hypothetical protein